MDINECNKNKNVELKKSLQKNKKVRFRSFLKVFNDISRHRISN